MNFSNFEKVKLCRNIYAHSKEHVFLRRMVQVFSGLLIINAQKTAPESEKYGNMALSKVALGQKTEAVD